MMILVVAGDPSGVPLTWTVATLEVDPMESARAVIVTVAEVDAARVPREQLTVEVPVHVPCVVDDDTKLRLDGSGSDTVTFVAGSPPEFVTTIVNVTSSPMETVEGKAVFVTVTAPLPPIGAKEALNCQLRMSCVPPAPPVPEVKPMNALV